MLAPPPPGCCSACEGGEAPPGQTRPMGHTEGKAGEGLGSQMVEA